MEISAFDLDDLSIDEQQMKRNELDGNLEVKDGRNDNNGFANGANFTDFLVRDQFNT